jgi:hypothetical protein
LHPIAVPAAYLSSDRLNTLEYWLVPSPRALENLSILIHEIAGWLTYKAMGYL